MEPKIELKRIAIAGVGGIGGWLVSNLYDFGFNRNQFPITSYSIDIFDDDTVDVKNLLHANYAEDDMGRMKVEVLSERYNGIFNPQPRFMAEEDFPQYDLIFSCVDSMTFRKGLYEYGWANPKLKWIDGRCTSRVIALLNSDTPKEVLEKYISDSKERNGCLYKFEKEQDISHASPIIAAAMMLQNFLNLLRGEKTEERVMMV